MTDRKLAVVTGASRGIGYQLARYAAQEGWSLVICADDADELEQAADKLRRLGAEVEALALDLSTAHGVDALWSALEGRDVDYLIANAGRALGRAFHDQDWEDVKTLIDLNIVQTTSLVHKVGRRMRERRAGRILITGSIGGFVPGPFDAVYNASKAYLDSFAFAIGEELKDSPVSVTVLMPGPTETEVFERNDLGDAPIADKQKDDPAMVARKGFDAMLAGERSATPTFRDKMIVALSGVVPDRLTAKLHRAGAEPQ
jgi:short-subunit dehydrogenase